ncbi:MAG: hypothetical protein MI810_03735 [Flavobacteriales bacterium]|jgi:hypothetical protein|nr:hypothetical protein [Flavobacteriales bacterium]
MAKWIGDRISTEDHPNDTTIIIYPIKKRVREILLTAWVLSFTLVGLYLIYILSTGVENLNAPEDWTEEDYRNQKVYLIVFIGFWAYFEYKTLKALLWYKFGKELIRIDTEALHVKRSIFSYGKSHRFFFENIKEFGAQERNETSFGQYFENAYWTVGTDAIGFKHFGKSKSFGRKLDEKSTRLLIRFIDDRIKKLRKKKAKAQ